MLWRRRCLHRRRCRVLLLALPLILRLLRSRRPLPVLLLFLMLPTNKTSAHEIPAFVVVLLTQRMMITAHGLLEDHRQAALLRVMEVLHSMDDVTASETINVSVDKKKTDDDAANGSTMTTTTTTVVTMTPCILAVPLLTTITGINRTAVLHLHLLVFRIIILIRPINNKPTLWPHNSTSQPYRARHGPLGRAARRVFIVRFCTTVVLPTIHGLIIIILITNVITTLPVVARSDEIIPSNQARATVIDCFFVCVCVFVCACAHVLQSKKPSHASSL